MFQLTLSLQDRNPALGLGEVVIANLSVTAWYSNGEPSPSSNAIQR